MVQFGLNNMWWDLDRKQCVGVNTQKRDVHAQCTSLRIGVRVRHCVWGLGLRLLMWSHAEKTQAAHGPLRGAYWVKTIGISMNWCDMCICSCFSVRRGQGKKVHSEREGTRGWGEEGERGGQQCLWVKGSKLQQYRPSAMRTQNHFKNGFVSYEHYHINMLSLFQGFWLRSVSFLTRLQTRIRCNKWLIVWLTENPSSTQMWCLYSFCITVKRLSLVICTVGLTRQHIWGHHLGSSWILLILLSFYTPLTVRV